MPEANENKGASHADLAYHRAMLPRVSRTFALTIPQLPRPLDLVVTNAYLLCRVADAIEDDPNINEVVRTGLYERLLAAVNDQAPPPAVSRELSAALTSATHPAERELAAALPLLLRVTATLTPEDQAAIRRCLRKMCHGMASFRSSATPQTLGLSSVEALDRYCYVVAGVVGEMLSELFCDYAADIEPARAALIEYAPSFGQGLQLTNILKDIWDDLERGACWLPRDLLAEAGCPVDRLGEIAKAPPASTRPAEFHRALNQLVGMAHAHLRRGFDYALLVPARHRGIRCFCLWSVALAIASLRRIHRHPDFRRGDDVKLSRATVGAVVGSTILNAGNDAALRGLLRVATRGLPIARLEAGTAATGDRSARPLPPPVGH